MSTFQFDKTRITPIKGCLDSLITKCGELRDHYKSAGDNYIDATGVFDEEVKGLTEWRDACDRLLNGTTRIPVTRENLHQWFCAVSGALDATTGLVLMFGMDLDLTEEMTQKYESLAGEFEKLDALVRSERELYR